MPDTQLPRLRPDDPWNALPEAARQRIWNKQADADLIRGRAIATIEDRYRSEANCDKEFHEYIRTGQPAIELAEANLQAALVVLSAVSDEFRAMGISGRELNHTLRNELDNIVSSFELTTIQRDLLWKELGLFRYSEQKPSHKRSDGPTQESTSSSLIGRLPKSALARLEAETAAFMADYLPKLEREGNKSGPVHDAELLRELVVHQFGLVARECMAVCDSVEHFDAELRAEIARFVHYGVSRYQWLADPMREELDTGFTFFVMRANPWAEIAEADRASGWHVGAAIGEALSHLALKLRAEAWKRMAAEGSKTPETALPASTALKADTHNFVVTGWDAVEISFLSDERVQIRCGLKTETCNYAEFGFADHRNGKPNQAWLTLRVLAQARGMIREGGTAGRDWPKIEKRVQEIRKALRNHFGISTDPIPFVEGTGYQACFKIGCSPSFDT